MTGINKDLWLRQYVPYRITQLEGAVWAAYVSLERGSMGGGPVPVSIQAPPFLEVEFRDVLVLSGMYFESGLMASRWLCNFMGMRLQRPERAKDGNSPKQTGVFGLISRPK